MQLTDTQIGNYVLKELLFVEAHLVATYRAYQTTLKRDVAVQILNPDDGKKDVYRRGFIRSAEIMASLEHPHIAPVHDVGEHDDMAYIVTRLMSGHSLRHRLDHETFTLPDIASIVRQIASALDYAHAQGQVHGDPSVANIAFDDGGNAYLADFHVAGIKQLTDEWVGTPALMAPELFREPKSTPVSDQYALGSIACMMLMQGTKILQDLQRFKMYPDTDLQHLQKYNPALPADVDEVIRRVLSHKPDDRYPTVMDFSRELEKALQSKTQNLFISYSRKDTDYAQKLKRDLKSNGFDVWIDDAIEHGEQWFNEIHEAIKECAAFLVIMSPSSEKSEWVHKEILLAKRYDKPIFPLLLNGQEFAILIDIQYADVQNNNMPEANFYRRLRRVIFGQA